MSGIIRIAYHSVAMERIFEYISVLVAIMEPLVQAEGKLIIKIIW